MRQKQITRVFAMMVIALMLIPQTTLAVKIPVAILRTNADGKTKTLTFTYAERPKVFSKNGRDGIHPLNKLGFPGQESLPSWFPQISGFIDEYNNHNITTVIFNKAFAQARPNTLALWFYHMRNLKTIQGIENLNTSNAESMYGMFAGCTNLETIDVSKFNTAKVKHFYGMFAGCTNLKEIDVSNFDTSKAIDLMSMFEGCENLTSLDLSGFNLANADFLVAMFKGCSNLKSIDISSFNTLGANLNSMFMGCSSLTSLDISQLKFDNVRWMNQFLADCPKLSTLIVGNNALNNLSQTDFVGNTIEKEKQIGNAFRNVGTFDSPCLLIVEDSFDKTVLGVKHKNNSEGFYRWHGGYFKLSSDNAKSGINQ